MNNSAYFNQIFIKANTSVKRALNIFEQFGKDAILIADESNQIIGILTKELVSKACKEKSGNASVKEIVEELNSELNKNNTPGETFLRLMGEVNVLTHEMEALKEVFKHSSDSIVVTDGNGNILLANNAFERNMGVKVIDVLGRNVIDLEQEKMFVPSVIALVLKEKRKITIAQKTRTNTDVVVTGVPIFDEKGNIHRVISNAKDFSELKEIKEYLQSNEEYVELSSANSSKTINVVYNSKVMQDILNIAQTVAKASSTVLITGESGAGKEVVARYIYQHSTRNKNKFVQINCGAIPESLMESELFGYEAGAFTGAIKGGKAGLIETADKGTLFLDEIGEMPLSMQVKLLTVIQNKQLTRVGGTKAIDVDIRYIAATNKDLRKSVEDGSFRLDLYYRLNVIPVNIPPLRDRREDILPIIEFLLNKLNKQFQKRVTFTDEVKDILLHYDWPGNIRELENVIENIIVITHKSTVEKFDLPEYFFTTYSNDPVIVKRITALEEVLTEAEKQLVNMAFKQHNSSYKLAKALGISQAAAHRKMQKYLKKE